MRMKRIHNWNLWPRVKAGIDQPGSEEECRDLIRSSSFLIARGCGRSYGDASLGSFVADMRGMNRILALDAAQYRIEAEAGCTLSQLIRYLLPRGFFLPVVPGTADITLGGAIAADVHGKNHHVAGSFCCHVIYLDLMDEMGRVQRCSREENREGFNACCGGMGISGLIIRAGLRIRPVETDRIRTRSIRLPDTEALLAAFAEHRATTYSVAWIDTLGSGKYSGRGVLLLGEHATRAELEKQGKKVTLKPGKKAVLNIPFPLPSFILNHLSIRLFNAFYYARHKDSGAQYQHLNRFFFPLDGIRNWNRLYGTKGFLQYQCLLPSDPAGTEALHEILQQCRLHRQASFLAVLKVFGSANPDAQMSFPREGVTLAMDLRRRKGLPEFLNRLDQIVEGAGGRLYLAKDARMGRDFFQRSYPGKTQSAYFVSGLSQRLGLNFNPPDMKKTVWIIGASSGIGEALSREFAGRGWSVLIAARRTAELTQLRESMESAGADPVRVHTLDICSPGSAENLIREAGGLPEVLVFTPGFLGNHLLSLINESEAERIMNINFNASVRFLQVFADAFRKRRSGTIVGISSVAGERGKSKNLIYSAAKAGFTAYLDGLRNLLFHDQVRVMTVKPGYVRTPMIAHLDLPHDMTLSPEQMASRIYKAMVKGKDVVYSSAKWKLMMFVLRHIPESMYKKRTWKSR